MRNFKVQHQNPIEIKMLFRPFQSSILPITNRQCKHEHLKSTYKDTSFILSLKQAKYLYRQFASSRFISNLKSIRKSGTYNCSENYLNETSKITMSNG